MTSQRGSALVLALLMLTLLMILGSAVLASVTFDVAIAQSYRSETQLLYLAEAGIEEARGVLQSSASASQLLSGAAGADGVLSTSRDLDTLLNSTDDIPILNGGNRTTGRLLADAVGAPAGRYFVFLRNDAADGVSSLTDSNQMLTLLSVAIIGDATKVLEVTVRKWRFPALPAALVLDGSPPAFTPSAGGAGISGMDASAGGAHQHAVGVLSAADGALLLAAIPAADQVRYPGSGNAVPPPADVAVIGMNHGPLDPRLAAPASIEQIADRVAAAASDIANPAFGVAAHLGNMGSSGDFRIVVVNGDCELGSGDGFGVLLVRGNLQLSGNFHWNGLILAIGQGMIGWSAAGNGLISGNVFVARTRAADRSAANPLGTVLSERGGVEVDFSGGGNRLQLDNPGPGVLDMAYRRFPFEAIAVREY